MSLSGSQEEDVTQCPSRVAKQERLVGWRSELCHGDGAVCQEQTGQGQGAPEVGEGAEQRWGD